VRGEGAEVSRHSLSLLGVCMCVCCVCGSEGGLLVVNLTGVCVSCPPSPPPPVERPRGPVWRTGQEGMTTGGGGAAHLSTYHWAGAGGGALAGGNPPPPPSSPQHTSDRSLIRIERREASGHQQPALSLSMPPPSFVLSHFLSGMISLAGPPSLPPPHATILPLVTICRNKGEEPM
jgi:hypothetical protein